LSDIFYRREGSEFLLIHQLTPGDKPEVFYRGTEVAIGFTYDANHIKEIAFTTHRHGSPESVEKWAQETRFKIQRARFEGVKLEDWALPHTISSDAWDVDELNRILNTTGYLGTALRKMGIDYGFSSPR
jgi:hypothetical protein